MMNRLARPFAALATAAALLFAVQAPAAAAEDVGSQMERAYGVIGTESREGRRLNDQLDRVVSRIVGAINQRQKVRDFRVTSAKILGGASRERDRDINAFALPDGRIYVTYGLISAVQNSAMPEDELAFVMAHEVGHVVESHGSEQQKKSLPYILGALLLGRVSGNRTIGTAAQVGAAAKMASYSRDDEYEADKVGLKAMMRAGYDPDGAVRMLERLAALGGSRSGIANWFATHPGGEARVQAVKKMIPEIRRKRNY